MYDGAVLCSSCIKSHAEWMLIERGGSDKFFMLPFDITVDLSILERENNDVANCFKKSQRISGGFMLGLTHESMHSSLDCNECVDNKDGTFTLSKICLVVVPRGRALVSNDFLGVCTPVMWDECFTERQCAGVALYCDVIAKILWTGGMGFTIHASESFVVRAVMCFFASLVKDPSADEVYESRYIALHGGSSTDKKCSVCEKVGDFSECQRCKAGIYICSLACQKLLHVDVCNTLVKNPMSQRTSDHVQALRLVHEIRTFTKMPSEVYRDHYCKPVLSRICEVCGVEANHKCNTCKKVYYCSKTCQTLAFPVHKRLHHD